MIETITSVRTTRIAVFKYIMMKRVLPQPYNTAAAGSAGGGGGEDEEYLSFLY